MKKMLDAKTLESKLKIGWTAADLAEYLDCSEEEIWIVLNTAFSKKAVIDFTRRLNQNQKKREKACKPPKSKIPVVAVMLKNPNDSDVNEVLEQQDVIEETEVKEEFSYDNLLNELKEKEQKLQKEVCDKETEKYALITEKKNLQATIGGQKTKLLQLRAEIEKIATEVERNVAKYYQLLDSIEYMNLEISEGQEKLDTLRRDIEDMQKNYIYVFANGDVEIEGPEQFSVKENWEEIYMQLVSKEIVEELTMKQIKILAKLIAFVSTVKNFEVTFEIEAVQEVFEKIIAEK